MTRFLCTGLTMSSVSNSKLIITLGKKQKRKNESSDEMSDAKQTPQQPFKDEVSQVFKNHHLPFQLLLETLFRSHHPTFFSDAG